MRNIIEKEQKACFDFFWNEVSLSDEVYGLIRDNTKNKNMCSIASIGFGLPAIVVGVERGYVSYEEAKERVVRTLRTMKEKPERIHGFYYHFIEMDTARRYSKCEISIIDTAIFLIGAIVAGEYFGSEVKEKVQQFYDAIDWNFYLDQSRNMFYMGYDPEKGFSGHWDVYGEQLMLYVLSAGSSTYPLDKKPYYTFSRLTGKYGGYEFVYSWFGSIFTYQFSHAFVDFRGKVDERGMDWYNNSAKATLAARQYCIDNAHLYKAYGENSWGLTACDTRDGYDGLIGSAPSGGNSTSHRSTGTVAAAGAIGSMPFAPEECIAALENYMTYPKFIGEYGLKDAYNLNQNWYAPDTLGIDKGISLLMIANYESEIIWDLFMRNENVQTGMEVLGFTDAQESETE